MDGGDVAGEQREDANISPTPRSLDEITERLAQMQAELDARAPLDAPPADDQSKRPG